MPHAADNFFSLFEFLPIGAYRSTPSGLQVGANPALVALNGNATEDEQLAHVSDIASEWYVDPQRGAEFMRLLEQDGSVKGFVSEVFRHKTRERIWISENAHVVKAADGTVQYYEGTVEDITERVLAEQALRDSEQRAALEDGPGQQRRRGLGLGFADRVRNLLAALLRTARLQPRGDQRAGPRPTDRPTSTGVRPDTSTNTASAPRTAAGAGSCRAAW